ncbi:alkaline phosphatase [Kitasatospora sp. MMS16-BH015]|uniref:DedA family protein n=1 Tax=Kitasatospora sp. MMS16-BH015 TaxID=2018025 RepID=UPI000CA2D9A9|nr:DedA family protein [Kitasatospora sp. MMS16-BH015]AUG81533.1 alkaline phosphatase [Kitasatospora sp. MMS16-BH015]
MTPPPLPGPLAHLAPLLDDYGYPSLALLVFLDNCGIPAPGQTILVLAAVYAGTGRMSIAAVAAIAFAAAAAGNTLGFVIGRTGGTAFVHRWGKYVLLTPERTAKAHAFFGRYGGRIVTVARFIDGLRQYNGIVAGTTELSWRRFLPANLAGAALWVGVWSTAGYLAGDNIGPIYREAVRYQNFLLIAAAVLLLAFLTYRWVRSRRRGKDEGQNRSGTTSKDDA